MRAVALILVIANLTYLGWALLIDAPRNAPAVGVGIDTNAPRLVLAKERAQATERAADLASARTAPALANAATLTNATVNSADAPQCVSVGPFQDLSSATQASATLKSAGHESRQRLEQGQLWVGYWVNVPGFANREEAEHAAAKLKQNGMNDVYISLSAGVGPESAKTTNVVSLGVFKESERAQRLLQEARALGFAAQVSDRTRSGSVYWVDVDLAPSAPKFDLSILGAQPGKILRLDQHRCPAQTGEKNREKSGG